jgi:photosystem II stability/assembly factor-like uncharacterized protein
VPTAVSTPFLQVQFIDQEFAWGNTLTSLWKTSDGESWVETRRAVKERLVGEIYGQDNFYRIQFFDRSEGWLLEGSHLSYTKDGGVSWVERKFKNVVARGFHFLDKKRGWVAGERFRVPTEKDEDLDSTGHGIVMTTTDGGTTWRETSLASPSKNGSNYTWTLHDVWAISPDDIWLVGDAIFHTKDGGMSWNELKLESREGVFGTPVRIRFLDSNVGWITTNQPGGYLLTRNGGKTWETRSGPDGGFSDLVYLSATDAWGAAGGLFHSTDSGLTWTRVLIGDYRSLHYSSERKILVAAGTRIAFNHVE